MHLTIDITMYVGQSLTDCTSLFSQTQALSNIKRSTPVGCLMKTGQAVCWPALLDYLSPDVGLQYSQIILTLSNV